MPKVVVDPGHGGYDPGAVGPGGLREKDFTLKIGLQLRDLLIKNGIDVKMTRETDTSPGGYNDLNAELNERVRISEAFMGSNGLFVSVHLNSVGGYPLVDGTETLVYVNSGGSAKAAGLVHGELVPVTGVLNRGVKIQDVLVLRKTSCPAILTESVFISNFREDSRLRDPVFIKALAVAHAKGICRYFGLPFTVSSGQQPPAQTPEVYRVKLNGKQIGAYHFKENALNMAQNALINATTGTRVWIEQKSDGKIIWDQTKQSSSPPQPQMTPVPPTVTQPPNITPTNPPLETTTPPPESDNSSGNGFINFWKNLFKSIFG